MSATGDHHPAAQQNEIRNTQIAPVDTQDIIELLEIKNVLELVLPDSEQLEKRRAPSAVQFYNTPDLSDAWSLITQAPQINSVHATINALSAWISAVRYRINVSKIWWLWVR